MNRRALLAIVVATAVVSSSVAWVLGRRIESPAEAADSAAAPEPSLITVPVESRELSSRVVIRGTVQASEETPIEVSTAALGNPVVTGLPKSEDDSLDEGEVAIEITGRPVIVLQGTLPAYRSMGPQSAGPDVAQLEAALVRLGYDPGDVDDVYTSATAAAVAKLYEDLGYDANEPTAEERDALELAEDQVEQADDALQDAQADRDGDGVPESVRLQQDQAVDQAKRQLDEARALPDDDPGREDAISDAETNLAIAEATRTETFESFTNGSEEGPSVADLQEDLRQAQSDLSELRSTVGVGFPLEELVFVPSLPRKVSGVGVELGSTASGAVMNLTGPSTVIDSVISTSDRRLIEEGMKAVVEDDGLGLSVTATVDFVAANPGGGDVANDRYSLRLEPDDDLPDEAINQSLRITIPISSTGGEVLVVPLAAVSAGPDGTSRVERLEDDGTTTLIDVNTGLAADGFVEVESTDVDLDEGDRVVVGRDLLLPVDDDEEPDDEEPNDARGADDESAESPERRWRDQSAAGL